GRHSFPFSVPPPEGSRCVPEPAHGEILIPRNGHGLPDAKAHALSPLQRILRKIISLSKFPGNRPGTANRLHLPVRRSPPGGNHTGFARLPRGRACSASSAP